MNFIFEYLKKHIFAVIIGVLGSLSAIVTLFIDVTQSISIKWFVFLIFIALVLITIFIGLIIELVKHNYENFNLDQLKLKDLNKNAGKGEVFLNESNIDFDYGDVVKVYYLDKDKIEKFIGIGVIEHTQKEQKICHINFLFKNKMDEKIDKVYFSLKINKDELKLIMDKE
jgi:hypothetical protein